MAKAKWPKLPAFTIPLFQSARVYLAVTKDEFQHADKFLGGNGDEKPFNLGMASNYENTGTGERIYLIGVFDKQIPTLVHECAHVCFYVCSDVGVTTNPEDANETYCYMLDRMFSHFLPFIKEQQDAA
ncbi:hypothetical protein AI2602V1_3499 [Citrobacter freundii]|uniref:hypothetical protein n=1 Tax=Citrobacter freundii TaxID=546 RepID=UPI001D3BEE3A|nr:hypothetical protein [Citrobacter freundii]CAE6158417.1 hypothetical protein AI2602V1_3499 [Citrobacter freundii]CAH3349973.1 hypothetical protein AI2602V1_3499 [Citrobacter freundii]CAH5962735.1 hypothetical protein AI3058V1_0695 [Citrobacter freundii]